MSEEKTANQEILFLKEKLSEAIIAEVASDVLKLRDDVGMLLPLMSQLKDGLPSHFDVLKNGLIDTLELINNGITEAGGEKIEFIKGQLHVYLEHAIGAAFVSYSEKMNLLVSQFEAQNKTAAASLRLQFDEVSTGLEKIGKIEIKKQNKIYLFGTVFCVIISICTAVTFWCLGSYKEAVYMSQYNNLILKDKHIK